MRLRSGRFVIGVAVLLVAPLLGAEAQQTPKIARLGVLLFSTPEGDPNLASFRQGLSELGYVEGKTLTTVYRAARGEPERLASLAVDLVALKPDVILAMGGDVAPFARTATNTIPIVMAVSNDPVRAGLVPSLARPGGNVTGVTFVSSELAAKRLQFLKEAAPRISRVAVLWNPDHIDPEYAETEAAGRTLGVRVQSLEVRSLADPQAGALLIYGPDLDATVRRAATYVDRILRGANPGDLAVEQPTRFDLVINVRTATALGLTIPPSLRVQASRTIE